MIFFRKITFFFLLLLSVGSHAGQGQPVTGADQVGAHVTPGTLTESNGAEGSAMATRKLADTIEYL